VVAFSQSFLLLQLSKVYGQSMEKATQALAKGPSSNSFSPIILGLSVKFYIYKKSSIFTTNNVALLEPYQTYDEPTQG